MNTALLHKSDETLLEALRAGLPDAFETLYRQYYRMVVKQVIDQGMNDVDAEDLFQEALLILVRKIRDPQFQLTSKLSTFLFAVARNLLLKKSSAKTEMSTGDIAQFQQENPTPDAEQEFRMERENQINVVVGYLELLEEDCNRLLHLSFFEKLPQSEIAVKMGYSEAFVKVKKHRCLDYLRKQVKTHPLFQHLKNTAS